MQKKWTNSREEEEEEVKDVEEKEQFVAKKQMSDAKLRTKHSCTNDDGALFDFFFCWMNIKNTKKKIKNMKKK